MAARRGELLEGLAKDISQKGGEALPVVCDLAGDEATSDLVRRTADAFGRIDLLVNNAGYSPGGAIEHFSREPARSWPAISNRVTTVITAWASTTGRSS